MDRNRAEDFIPKLKTHIEGFEHISKGGLPEGRTTLVCGTAGSAKTVFAMQFLAEAIQQEGKSGVFVTFEESPKDIRKNVEGFGWDIEKWEKEGKWGFVDASMNIDEEITEAGLYDFGALAARVAHAVKKIGAERVSIDSVSAIFMRYKRIDTIRTELYRLATALKSIGVTVVMTAERTSEDGEVSRYNIEEFVSDNVIILRNVLESEKRRRTIEILKFRGTLHMKGEYPFTVMPGKGMVVIPLSAIELGQKSTNLRISSGNHELDAMCGGGFFRDSIILVSGPTGTGKTLMGTEFVRGGVEKDERCLVLAFEESREQLFRNASGCGMDYEGYEKGGKLRIICRYPEVMGLEDHLIQIKYAIEDFKPSRVVVDSLSALERVSSTKSFREFVIGLTSFIKHKELAGVLTSATTSLLGGDSITDSHISTITDSIIIMRYVEIMGEIRRGISVLKMRGSMHDKQIREFTIDHEGVHIREAFRNISGILCGNPKFEPQQETERLESMFGDNRG